jgi:predicted transcriptional regulator
MNTTLTKDQLMMAAIMRRGEPMKVAALAHAAGIGETTARRVIKELVITGILVRTDEGTYNMATASKTKKAAEKKAAVNPRGKRPDSAARDDAVFAAIKKLKDGASKTAVAEAVGGEPGKTYLSIWRLKHEGRVEIVRVEGSRTPIYRVVAAATS